MYKANLSWIPLQEVFQSLLAQEIIIENERNRRKQYLITEKGIRALKYFEGMAKLIKIEAVQ